MIEKILIIILSVLVILLLGIILFRRRRETGMVRIKEAALNDMVESLMENVTSGRIQEIAGSVSKILIKHLSCDRIVFLKKRQNSFELNYFYGINRFDRNIFRINIPAAHQKRLKLYNKINSLSRLKSIVDEKYVKTLESFELKYFFPVYLRENLFGVYFIKTTLSEMDPALNLIATTLAFNLSSAYHSGLQDFRIRKYKSRITALSESAKVDTVKDINRPDTKGLINPGSRYEYMRYLKIRNCQQLIPELVKKLKDTGEFSRLGLITSNENSDNGFINAGWNTDGKVEKLIRHNYAILLSRLKSNEVIRLSDFSSTEKSTGMVVKSLQDLDYDHIAAVSWGEKNRALLVFNSGDDEGHLQLKLKSFASFAAPLVENVRRFEKAEELSYTDGLTGMYNFRYFKKRIEEEFHRANRYKRDLALIIFDIDDLKTVNDRHGHLAGDALIKLFGSTLMKSLRSNDVVCRYGGDEFCVIMPDTNRDEVRYFMKRIIGKIDENENYLNWSEQKLKYTVSMGGAVYPNDASEINELIHSADMALLKAKQEGRNRAFLFDPEMNIDK